MDGNVQICERIYAEAQRHCAECAPPCALCQKWKSIILFWMRCFISKNYICSSSSAGGPGSLVWPALKASGRAQWHRGTVRAQWHSGTTAQWHSGTVAQWHRLLRPVAQWRKALALPPTLHLFLFSECNQICCKTMQNTKSKQPRSKALTNTSK